MQVHATDACTQLVKYAEARWKEEEGSYRDDITCIIAFLPFLESQWDADAAVGDDEHEEEHPEDNMIMLNSGAPPRPTSVETVGLVRGGSA